jgi:hypothetical protein
VSRDETRIERRGEWHGEASARVVKARYAEAEELLRELAFVCHATRSVRDAMTESISLSERR